VQRSGAVLQEIWEDGRAFLQLNERSRAVVSAKDAAETQRKAVKRKLPLPPSGAGAAVAAGQGLTLVHFSAQPEPSPTLKTSPRPLNP
jgi:tousled-like kinase